MEVKKAIEFLEERKNYAWSFLELDKIDEVISLLQQGEANKQIVNYLEKYCGYYYYGSSDNLSQLIPRLKKKYFPKEAKQDKANEQVEN